MSSKYIVHEAPSDYLPNEVRYYIIYAEGQNKGVRVCYHDPEWQSVQSVINEFECGMDKQYNFEDPKLGSVFDPTVRFYSEEAALFYLYAAERTQQALGSLRRSLLGEMPPIDRVYTYESEFE